MVCFSCAACGESMKKAQVENHRRQCRGCKSMSCLDCGKEFRGEEYQMHLKCITEKEKYGSKDFDAKQGKGNSKQSQSLEVSVLIGNLCIHFDVTGCVFAFQIQKSGAGTLDSTLEKEDAVNEKVEGAMKLDKNSKREKKRKRKEKKEAESAGEVCEQEERSRTKKQKSEDATDADVELNNENPSVEKKKKKKKKSTDKDSENCGVENDKQKQKKKEQEMSSHFCPLLFLPGEKFSWKSAIKSILQEAEGNQMSAKKLRKKVIAQYQVHTSGKPTLSENELKTNFDKVIVKNPKFSLVEDKVSLLV
uniref:Cell growth-regulating nucleolar protein n=1 Tax=Eptatretus burgeri TaxID=7764 RepID=A0A8C4Q228_EPTBU